MNPSNPYNRNQRRDGKFVITQPVVQRLIHNSKWVRFLEAIRFRKKITRTVTAYMRVDHTKDQPEWVTNIAESTPFKFELAHQFIKELELKNAQAKLLAKYQGKLIAI